jgi:ABC-type Fe3+ transport system substrate-binding protein
MRTTIVSERRYRLVAGAGAATLLAAALAACSSSAKQSNSDVLVGGGADRDAQLVKEAKAEGKLNWNTSLAGPVVNAIVDAFQKKYPGIHVSVNRADEGVIIPQAVQAIGAGKSAADVFEATASGALEFKDAGVLQPYDEPNAVGLSDEWKAADPSGKHLILVADRISYISFGYNKTKLAAADVPKTLEDLLNPALAGKMAIESDTTSEEWIGAVIHKMGQEAGEAFLQKLSKQKLAQTALSGSATMGLVATGQYTASPSVFHNHEEQNAAKGAPVAWVPLEPVIANVGQLGILKNAAHPAAAMLFVDFMTGSAGQGVLKSKLYSPPEEKQPFTTWIPSEGVEDAEAYNEQLKSWAELQKKYFG